MKVYVVPTEKLCNGSCSFCVTNSRDKINSEFLEVDKLEAALERFDISKIEITGGGEPLLNKNIEDIIQVCSDKAYTRMYTNGGLLHKYNISLLDELCISRGHYRDDVNENIMGVRYNMQDVLHENTKLSLLLHKDGINSYDDFFEYVKWANKLGIKKVVVRELFERDGKNYQSIYEDQLVKIDSFIEDVDNDFEMLEGEDNLFYKYDNAVVEFEVCGCNLTPSLVLRSDGNWYLGWDSNEVL
jgi:molybdenum cofactor biosynthesis enzyme MoaA